MFETHLTITVYSHYFSCTKLSPRGRGVCAGFAKPLVQWKTQIERGHAFRVMDRVYAAADASRAYFHFHIYQLEQFKDYLRENQLTDNLVEWVVAPQAKAQTVSLTVQPQWKVRDDQVDDYNYLIESPHPSRLLTRQTGTGKTAVALMAAATFQQRIGIVLKPMYVDKWISDVLKTYEIRQDEILVIQGSKALIATLLLAKFEPERFAKYKVVIASITTIQNWITEYEDHGNRTLDEGYACYPWEFFETIGVGVKIVDEVHQFFHQMFKLDLYTHTQHSISLSATLISRDSFMMRMYEIMFPLRVRPREVALNKYIQSFAIHYNFIKPEKIHTKERGSKFYSHNAVEKSIMAHVPTMLNYMRLIDETVRIGYLEHPRPKKKCAIYASTIEMCTKITEYFARKYPHLDVRRYTGDDPYENVIDADVRVSTIGSSGTAIDIPDLTTTVVTVGISSIQANIQVLGRLRDLKDGSDVKFYFFTADNLEKHEKYYDEKRDLLKERAATFRDIFSGMQV